MKHKEGNQADCSIFSVSVAEVPSTPSVCLERDNDTDNRENNSCFYKPKHSPQSKSVNTPCAGKFKLQYK